MIEQFLLEGKGNAIASQRLADLAGCKSVRELQEVIAAERAAGAVILSTCQNGGGYFCQRGTNKRLLNLFIHCRDEQKIHWQLLNPQRLI